MWPHHLHFNSLIFKPCSTYIVKLSKNNCLTVYLQLLTQKANIARALHQIRFADGELMGTTHGSRSNDDVLTSITQFSLQLLHESGQQQMACGILRLDLSLIGSVGEKRHLKLYNH